MDNDRLKKLEEIKALGINPYPEKCEQTHSLNEAFEEGTGTKVKVAGRMMTLREMGKLAFAHLQDFSGRMQIAFQVDEIGKDKMKFLRLLDLGDYLSVEGEVFVTHKGEISILVNEFSLISKAMRPLPEKWHGLKDREVCYRQRYLDMASNPETLKRFRFRSRFVKLVRNFLDSHSFEEIETPILATKAGGALARPFLTHHNALDIELTLRIAPETYLKRATVGGYERVYEFAKCFRNEGMDPSHLQEFTMLEYYAVFWNYEDNMDFTEQMLSHVIQELFGTLKMEIDGKKIDFQAPWPRVSFGKLIQKDCGIDIYKEDTADKLKAAIEKKKIQIDDLDKLGWPNMTDALYKKVSRPNIVDPTFVCQHPVDLKPLARRNDENEKLADSFQLLINGWEVVNAYSEIVDPIDQRRRFEIQSELKASGDEEAMEAEEDFVTCMEHGMPPQSGWGMGIDRIVALLTQSENLKDVVMFPLMRPETKEFSSDDLLVIGEIVEVVKHEKKNHINICTVDLGSHGQKSIVCAAENVRVGLKVVVSLPGYIMLNYNGDGKIAYTVCERKTYGAMSEAVMCAPEEIGIKEDDPVKQALILEVDLDIDNGTYFKEVGDKILGY